MKSIRYMNKKIYRFTMIPSYLLALIIVLIARAVRPLVLIRFGAMTSARIGHLVTETELYLCERDLGIHVNVIDIFFCSKPVANRQLIKMFKRLLYINLLFAGVPRVNRMLPGYEVHEVPAVKNRDVKDLLIRTPPHLLFTSEEEKVGQAALRNMGLPASASFVCIHARESSYLDKILPGKNWDYNSHRNSNIYNFIPAANELVSRGYFAVRTGAYVKDHLHNTNSKIIDYAKMYRTDFLDIFLSANCRFLIGSPCGYTHLAYDLFRKPLVCVDFSCLEYMYTWNDKCLFIPKKFWLRKDRRFMGFRELFNSGVGRFFRTELFEEHEIEVIDNTPEEIFAVAIEMDERLKGLWTTSEVDEELQKRFWDLFPESELHGVIRSRVGAEFLRQNRELLS